MRRAILVAVAALVVVLALLEAAGARAHVGVLSGTLPASDAGLALGVAYVLAWFAVVLAAPIALLAMLLDAACGRIASTWRASRRR